MASYDEDSYDTNSYDIYSHSFADIIYAGWTEIKKFTVHIIRSALFQSRIR